MMGLVQDDEGGSGGGSSNQARNQVPRAHLDSHKVFHSQPLLLDDGEKAKEAPFALYVFTHYTKGKESEITSLKISLYATVMKEKEGVHFVFFPYSLWWTKLKGKGVI